jgi:hypothetical protein
VKLPELPFFPDSPYASPAGFHGQQRQSPTSQPTVLPARWDFPVDNLWASWGRCIVSSRLSYTDNCLLSFPRSRPELPVYRFV